MLKWDKVIKEMKKCILVCSNCHGEIHQNIISKEYVENIYNKKWKKINKSINTNIKPIIKPIKKLDKKQCPICKKLFQPDRKNRTYCSDKCNRFRRRKVKDRPTKKQLLKDIKETNYCSTGRKYGVSDNTIRKWLK